MSRMLLLSLVSLTLCLGLSRPGAAAPSISGITVNPNPVPAAGGQVTVTATVTDSVGLSSVVLQEGRPNYNFPYRTAPMSVGADGVTYTATIPVDFNTSNGSNGETLSITAADPAGSKTASVATQTYSNTPPSITAVTASPLPIPAAGTRVTVKAKVTDPALGLSSVVLQEGRPNYNFPYRTAPMSVGADGVTYTATIPVDFNTSNGSNGETLNILATDPAGNQSSYTVASQGYSNTAPSITAVNYSPNPIPVQGANVTVTARVSDPALGLSSVVLQEGRPNYNFPYRTAPMSVGADGVTYTATIPVDLNGSSGANGESLYIVATDPAGNQTTNSVGTQGFSSVPPFGSLPVLISADPAVPVLSPAFISAGGADLPLVINGINFASGAVVLFNGFQLPLASYTSRQITVNIPSSLIAQPGSYAVTVIDPSPSGASNSVSLVVK